MRRILWSLAGAILASSAAAAEIHGTVSEGGKPLGSVAMKLDCGGTEASGKTDEFGSYSLKIAASGECRLTLDYKGGNPSLKLTVYERPSRYDLVVSTEGGKPVVRRK